MTRRINIPHRLVYQVLAEERVVKVHSMWTHDEGANKRKDLTRPMQTVLGSNRSPRKSCTDRSTEKRTRDRRQKGLGD